MEPENRLLKEPGERLPVLALAVVVTLLVFAAINAGFTPHAADLAGLERTPAASLRL